MNKTFIHIIFIPIIAGLLMAWSYFGKMSDSQLEFHSAPEPASMITEYSGNVSQVNTPSENGNNPALEQTQNAYEQGSNHYKIAELNTNIAEVKAEISSLRGKQDNSTTQEELHRNEVVQKFESSLQIINHTDITEFETSEARPDVALALNDFFVESEHIRDLGIQVDACTSFGCQLSIGKETQPIAELMRLNRVMMEQGESRFGASSLHLVSSGNDQRIILVWQN